MLLTLVSSVVWAAWYEEPPLSVDAERLLEVAAEQPPEEDGFTFLLDDRTLRYDDAGKLAITLHYVYRIDKVGDGSWTTNAPVWHPWFQERPTGDVRVIKPDGTEVRLDPKTLLERAGSSGNRMVSDEHRLSAPLPGLESGAVVEEVWTVKDHRPYSLAGSSAWVGLDARGSRPRFRVRVEAPPKLPLTWQVVGDDPPPVRRSKVDGRIVLAIDLVDEGTEPAWVRSLPLATPVLPSFTVTSVPSWNALAVAWRKEAEAAVDATGWEALVEEVKAAKDRRTAVTLATRGVQDVVRYTGLELGARSIVPWMPAEVKERGYGDCKDQATTVVAVLRAAGFPAEVALLRRGYDTEPVELLPGLDHFNHAIVHVPGDPPLWVDVTNPEVAIGDLPRDDQDRWALITTADAKDVVRTPSYPGAIELSTTYDLTRPGFGFVTEERTLSGWLGHELRTTPEDEKTLLDWDRRREQTKAQRRGPLLTWAGPSDARVNDPITSVATWREPAAAAFGAASARIAAPRWSVLSPLWQVRVPEEDEADDAVVRTQPFRGVGTWTWQLPPGLTLEKAPQDWSTTVGPYAVAIDWTVEPGRVQARVEASLTSSRVTVAQARRIADALKDADDHLEPLLQPRDVPLKLADDGHATDALAAARSAVKDPTDVDGRLALVRLLVRLGQVDAARDEADALAEAVPADARAAWARLWTRWPSAMEPSEVDDEDRDVAVAVAEDLWKRGEAGAAEVLVALLGGGRKDDRAVRDARSDRILAVAAEARTRGAATVPVLEAEADALVELGRWDDLRTGALPGSVSAQASKLLAVARSQGPDALRTALQALPEHDRPMLSRELGSLALERHAFDVVLQLVKADPEANSRQARAMLDTLGRLRPWREIVAEGGPRGLVARYAEAGTRDAVPDRSVVTPLLEDWSALVRSPKKARRDLDADPDGLVDFVTASFETDGDDGQGGARWVSKLLQSEAAAAMYVTGTGAKARVASHTDAWPVTAAVALEHAARGRRAAAETWYGWLRKDVKKDSPGADLVRKLTPVDPPEGRGLDELLTVLASVAEPKRAQAAWRVAQTRQGDEAARMQLLVVLAAGRAGDDALVAAASDALAAHAKLPDDVRRALGMIGSLKVHEAGVELGERMYAAHPDQTSWVLGELGQLRALGRNDEAIAITRALPAPERQGEANNLAWMLLLSGRPEEAVAELQSAVSARDGSDDERHTLACALADLGRVDDAQRLLDRHLGHGGRVPSQWWYVVGRLAEHWGRPDAARRAYLRVDEDPLPDATWTLAKRRLDALAAD